MNNAKVDGCIGPGRDGFRFSQTSSTGNIQLSKFVGNDLGQIDLVIAETRLEEQENVVHFADSEEFDQEHGSKKDHHFPDAYKNVGEVTG